MDEEIIWAPWRASFILSEKEKGCILCNRFKMEDTVENLIVHRGESSFVILNKFPYNAGHTMVVPNRHIDQLEKMNPAEAAEFFELTRLSIRILKRCFKPHAFNIGMNLGELSGAGIPAHVHMHIVPRWTGDSNFMPVLGKTKVVSFPLEPFYDCLREEFSKV